MEITDILEQTGLNEKEAQVYLALLELGTATVHPIANKAGIKRPTTYLILEQLKQKGMISVIPREKKVMFTAESPEKLLQDLSKKQELVKRFMPNMLALYNAKKDKPKVLLFEGKNAVGELYEKILLAKNVNFFSTIWDIISLFPDYPKRLNDRASEGKMHVRELLTMHAGDIAYAKSMKHNEYFEHRFTPGAGEFLTDNCLFDGNVAFFSFEPVTFAVLIQSQGIYKSLKSLFEFAWMAAEPYEKVLEKKSA